ERCPLFRPERCFQNPVRSGQRRRYNVNVDRYPSGDRIQIPNTEKHGPAPANHSRGDTVLVLLAGLRWITNAADRMMPRRRRRVRKLAGASERNPFQGYAENAYPWLIS